MILTHVARVGTTRSAAQAKPTYFVISRADLDVNTRILWATIAIVCGSHWCALAQVRVRFPQSGGASVAQLPSQPPAATPPSTVAPPAAPPAIPAAPPATTPPAASSFDPYAPGGSATTPPSLLGSPAPSAGSTWTVPPTGTTTPGVAPPPSTLGTVQPQTPPALFPNGLGSWNPNANTAYGAAPMRFLYGPRVRYTWLYPKSGDREFGSNDFDVSVTMTVPNFLWSGRPLFVTPAFGLHLWDGPKPPVMSHLPSKAYDAYLDAGWSTDPARIFSGEVGVRVGVYSDFNTIASESVRLQGIGQFHVQVTPTVRLTGGVLYLNRNKYKLFPTFGVLWEPNSRTRFDIYFPRPKLAKYVSTIGNYDVWMYLGAEYGGGWWLIEHPDGFNDKIDINDIRLFAGVEWGQQSLMKKGKRIGFIEAGWVTEREILYVNRPADSVTLSDTFMLRAGIGY